MSKVILRDACYTGIPDIKRCEVILTDEHKALIEEANRKIEEAQIYHMAAYENARTYLGGNI